MKISEAFDLYEYHVALEGQARSVIDHTNYVKRKMVERFGDIDLDALDLKKIYQWKEFMIYKESQNGEKALRKPNTLRCDLLRVRCMLKYMQECGESCMNYKLVPIQKREDIRRNYLDKEEVARMIDSAYCVKNQFIISLLYSSGIRVSEIIELDRDSIHDRCFSVVGKGKKLRLCFIDERTEQLMNEYLATRKDKSRALIVSEVYKDRVSVSTIQLIVKNTAARAGIDKQVTPHTLRHSFATNFIKNNGGVKPLSELLGHASLDTTSIYTHIENPELKQYYNQFHTV